MPLVVAAVVVDVAVVAVAAAVVVVVVVVFVVLVVVVAVAALLLCMSRWLPLSYTKYCFPVFLEMCLAPNHHTLTYSLTTASTPVS